MMRTTLVNVPGEGTRPVRLLSLLAAAVLCGFGFGCAGNAVDAVPDAGLPDSGDPDGGDPDGGDGGGSDGGTDGGTDGGGHACGTPWQGDRQFGSAQADEALALAVDSDDVVYVGGYEQGTLGATVDPSGNARGFLLALSAQGGEISKRNFSAGTTTVETITIQGKDALVIGRTTGRMGPGTPAGMFDAFLARAPLDGGAPEVLWQGGTERPEHPRSASLGPQGQLFVAGWIDMYVPSNYVERWEDELTFSLGLLDRTAELLWLRSGTLDTTDTAAAVAADPLRPGGYAVTGSVLAGPTRGPFVRLVAEDGTEKWSRILTTVGVDNAAGLAFASDGNLIVAGSTFTTIFGKPYGDQDVYVAKLDRATGETLWSTQYGSAGADWVKAMTIDRRGTIAIAGETLGDFTGNTPNAGDYDAFALVLSADGDVLGKWQKGSPADDQVHAIAMDSCSRIFVAGTTHGALFGPNLGSRDAWVAQVKY